MGKDGTGSQKKQTTRRKIYIIVTCKVFAAHNQAASQT